MKNVTRQNKIKLNIKMMLESLLKQTDNHYMLFKRSKVVIVHDRKVGKMSWCKRIEKKELVIIVRCNLNYFAYRRIAKEMMNA
jgi:hypothetical protein